MTDARSDTDGAPGHGEAGMAPGGRRVPRPEVPGRDVPDATGGGPAAPDAGGGPAANGAAAWPPAPPAAPQGLTPAAAPSAQTPASAPSAQTPLPAPPLPPGAGGPAGSAPSVPASGGTGPTSSSGAAGSASGAPEVRAASSEEPFYAPSASWRWPHAVAGLALGAAPEALLTLAALVAGASSSTGGKVTAGSAAALAVGSLVLYGWQVLAAWLFSLRTAGRRLALWGFRRPTRAIFWTVPLGLAAVYVVSVVHDIIVRPEQQQIISEFPRSEMGVGLFVLVAVIMAPLFEEIVFRGFLFRGLANSWGWLWGALASSAVFGLAHLQLDVFLPLATLGFALAWAYKRTGSLWTCIAMHAIFNLIAVVAWALTG